jgi:hypothetical protein
VTALLPGTGQSLADLAAANLTPAEAKQREALLRQVLPLWGRVLPDATIAVVVALTAEIASENFRAAVLAFARTEERLSWDNPIPMLLAADRRMRADAAAAREEAARAERKAEAVPMPDAVRERMGKMFGGRDLGGGK